ncbi:Rv2175c family DNA-binding protein [soil metagenome]
MCGCVPKTAPTSYTAPVSSIPAGDDVLDPDEPVYDLPTVAEMLRIPVSKVNQQLRDGHLVAVRRNGVLLVPQVFFTPSGTAVKHLAGLIAVLRDGGFQTTEIVRWLFTADPSLTATFDGDREPVVNARPADALHSHQAREVVRRAQASGY